MELYKETVKKTLYLHLLYNNNVLISGNVDIN